MHISFCFTWAFHAQQNSKMQINSSIVGIQLSFDNSWNWCLRRKVKNSEFSRLRIDRDLWDENRLKHVIKFHFDDRQSTHGWSRSWGELCHRLRRWKFNFKKNQMNQTATPKQQSSDNSVLEMTQRIASLIHDKYFLFIIPFDLSENDREHGRLQYNRNLMSRISRQFSDDWNSFKAIIELIFSNQIIDFDRRRFCIVQFAVRPEANIERE